MCFCVVMVTFLFLKKKKKKKKKKVMDSQMMIKICIIRLVGLEIGILVVFTLQN